MKKFLEGRFAKVCSRISGELNQHYVGDISSRLSDYTDQFNRKIVEKSFADSRQQFTVTDENLKKIWQYPGLIYCRN